MDAPRRLSGGTPEVGEVEAAPGVEHQVVWHVAGLRRDDRLHPRAVRPHRSDGTDTLGDIQRGNEDAPVFVDREATGTKLSPAGDSEEPFFRRQAKYAPTVHVAEEQVA